MSLDPSRFSQLEFVNSNWVVTVEQNVTLEDVLKPPFFSNVAAQMHPYDHIRVRIDSGEWYAELLVTSCGRGWAKTVVLYEHSLVSIDASQEGGDLDQYKAEWKGPHRKWTVIRKDGEIVKEGCADKEEAHSWIRNYLLTM